jgi:hypothetical protein
MRAAHDIFDMQHRILFIAAGGLKGRSLTGSVLVVAQPDDDAIRDTGKTLDRW